MKKETKKGEEAPVRKHFNELTEEEKSAKLDLVSTLTCKLGEAMYDCGVTNRQCVQMLAVAVTSILPPPKGSEELFFALFLSELKTCYQMGKIYEVVSKEENGQE